MHYDLLKMHVGIHFNVRDLLNAEWLLTILRTEEISKVSTSPLAERFYSQTGRLEVMGSILGCACRPCRLEFSLVYSETHVNTG